MKFCLNVQSQWLIVIGGKDAITGTRVKVMPVQVQQNPENTVCMFT